ncbi:diguanylate cyclase [Halalkalibacter urbisdiaboli]|uniref:diguanylate cyclase n=1 Tax=Halalkalibacter urbisdiaboli TaxID=1960589 RepID=UPI000B43D58D|nr:diguanylate cyclase [Halalkalibacter urbisdiaboli]
MHLMFYTFFENMAFIVTFVFLGLKLQSFLIGRISASFFNKLIIPLFFCFISIWVMMFIPFQFEGVRLDLRSAPLLLVSYIGGWQVGLVAIIPTTIYRFSLGGPTVIQGITQGVFLPFFIGSLFHMIHSIGKFKACETLINMKKIISVLMLFEIIQGTLILLTTPATFPIVFLMMIFHTFAVLGMCLMINDFNRASQQKIELEFISNNDDLTQIPNIRCFKEQVRKRMNSKKKLAIAMFDVDYFKQYNDTNGHQAGDVVLKIIGQILEENMSDKAIFARYGGEEFIIYFDTSRSPDMTLTLTEQLRSKVEEFVFYGEKTQPNQKVTISIGISYANGDGTLEEVIEQADKALYLAKANGRNRIEIA